MFGAYAVVVPGEGLMVSRIYELENDGEGWVCPESPSVRFPKDGWYKLANRGEHTTPSPLIDHERMTLWYVSPSKEAVDGFRFGASVGYRSHRPQTVSAGSAN